MRTLFVTDPPQPVEDWLARRRALGQDHFDEVWEGEYHVAPAPTRAHAIVDDELGWMLRPLAAGAGLVGARADLTWNPSAAIVVEVVSAGDESHAKLGFYHRSGVEEVLIADPVQRTVEWFVRGPDAFRPADRSALLGISAAELTTAIDWPA
jgi:hypothetical protein